MMSTTVADAVKFATDNGCLLYGSRHYGHAEQDSDWDLFGSANLETIFTAAGWNKHRPPTEDRNATCVFTHPDIGLSVEVKLVIDMNVQKTFRDTLGSVMRHWPKKMRAQMVYAYHEALINFGVM